VSCSRWVSICADINDHPIVGIKNPQRMAWWIWMITNVSWRDRAVPHKGRAVKLQRGQLVAGRAYLAKEWGCTEKQVRVFLDLLESEHMIERGQSNGHFANIITICNYDDYQNTREGQTTDQGQCAASAGPVQGQTLTRDTIVTLDRDSLEQTYAADAAPVLREEPKRQRKPKAAPLADQPSLLGEDGKLPGKLTPRQVAQHCFDLYNALAKKRGYATARNFDDKRAGDIVRRLREFSGGDATSGKLIETFKECLAAVERSPFLKGETSHGFKMTLNFLCQRESFQKVMEGGYERSTPAFGKVKAGASLTGISEFSPEYLAKLRAAREATRREALGDDT
jgi:hypothetical protein